VPEALSNLRVYQRGRPSTLRRTIDIAEDPAERIQGGRGLPALQLTLEPSINLPEDNTEWCTHCRHKSVPGFLGTVAFEREAPGRVEVTSPLY
jgi:hypothetical protein